ncbi:hypothetical protein J7J23_01990 [bacterium]|nr:hypothetical protein [bacterium]
MAVSFEEIESKIKGVILGVLGSIIASFSIALGVSVLTSDSWTIIFSGLIVGIASSFANSLAPLTSKSRLISSRSFSKEDLWQVIISLVFTFVVVGLPLLPYPIMENLNIARVISITTGLVLLFIFAGNKAQLENDSPIGYALGIVTVGIIIAALSYYIPLYFIK